MKGGSLTVVFGYSLDSSPGFSPVGFLAFRVFRVPLAFRMLTDQCNTEHDGRFS